MSLIGAVDGDHLDVQELFTTGSAPHRVQGSGELAPSFTYGNTPETRPCASPRLQGGAGLDGRGVG